MDILLKGYFRFFIKSELDFCITLEMLMKTSLFPGYEYSQGKHTLK